MSDWVTNALIGLGIEQEQAAYVAQVFRSIRTLPEPDALQVLLGVVHDTANQAQDADADLAAAREHAAAAEADAARAYAAGMRAAADVCDARAVYASEQLPRTEYYTDRRDEAEACADEIRAALAARDPQAAVTTVGERKDE